MKKNEYLILLKEEILENKYKFCYLQYELDGMLLLDYILEYPNKHMIKYYYQKKF